MGKKTYRISREIKQEILKKIKDEGLSVSDAAEQYGISGRSIYGWLTKGVSDHPSLSELIKLKKENQALFKLVGELTLDLSNSQKKR